MGYEAIKTEHSGPKKGSGAFWGQKVDAKKQSNRKRREQNKVLIQSEKATNISKHSKDKQEK